MKTVIGSMKDELDGQIMKKFLGLRGRTYIYLKDNNDEDKKAKGTKRKKRKLKFKDYKNYLEAAQIENKINHLEKNKIDADNSKEDKKELIKNNKLILKIQQRFRSEKHVFTDEINKIVVNSSDNKRMQSSDLIETYAPRTSKDLVCKKEE